MKKILLMVMCTAFLATGGPAAQAQGRANCATANADIAHLEHEKKSTVERMAKGVTSIMPIGLALNLVRGTEKENVEMATGEYNQKIEMRIAEIKDTCGIR